MHLNLFLGAFIDDCAGAEFVKVKALDVLYEEHLERLNHSLGQALSALLESLGRLELDIVYHTDGCRPAAGVCHIFHELDTNIEGVEDDRCILLDLRNGSHADHSLSHDSKVALVTHHDVVQVRTCLLYTSDAADE